MEVERDRGLFGCYGPILPLRKFTRTRDAYHERSLFVLKLSDAPYAILG